MSSIVIDYLYFTVTRSVTCNNTIQMYSIIVCAILYLKTNSEKISFYIFNTALNTANNNTPMTIRTAVNSIARMTVIITAANKTIGSMSLNAALKIKLNKPMLYYTAQCYR